MSKSRIIQILIFILIIIIIFFSYNYLLDVNKKNNFLSSNKKLENKKVTIDKDSELEFIEELNYISTDEKGNIYEIFSKSGKINEEDQDILLLEKVYAKISIKNSGKIYIYSDNAKYNKSNLNTHFFNNVSLDYEDHNIKSDNIYLDYITKEVKIAKNVRYADSYNQINADAIDMDLVTKFSKIYMIDKKKKITATIKN